MHIEPRDYKITGKRRTAWLSLVRLHREGSGSAKGSNCCRHASTADPLAHTGTDYAHRGSGSFAARAVVVAVEAVRV